MGSLRCRAAGVGVAGTTRAADCGVAFPAVSGPPDARGKPWFESARAVFGAGRDTTAPCPPSVAASECGGEHNGHGMVWAQNFYRPPRAWRRRTVLPYT